MAIGIDFFANTSKLLRGTKDVEGALEKVGSTLDDVAADSRKTADRMGDDLADGITDGTKDAERSIERLEKTFRELATEGKKASASTGDTLGDSVQRGTKKAEGALDEFKSEANSTAKESAASFDGSAESIVGSFQEIAANAFAGFGPAGAIAGLAAAAGIGLAMAGLEDAKEETERLTEMAMALAEEYRNTGVIGEASYGYMADHVAALADAAGEGSDSLRGLKKISDQAEGSLADLARAGALGTDELREMWRESERAKDAILEQIAATDRSTEAGEDAYWDLVARSGAQEKYTDELGKSIGVSVTAAEAAKAAAEAGLPELQLKAAAVAAVNDAYDDAAGAVDDYTNKESGLFDVEAYLTAMAARTQALATYQESLATSGLTPEAKAFLNDQGAESAATFLAGYMATSEPNKAKLNGVWTEAGKANSAEYAGALTKGIQGAPIPAPTIGVPIVPIPDMTKLEAALRPRTLRIMLEGNDRSGKRVF